MFRFVLLSLFTTIVSACVHSDMSMTGKKAMLMQVPEPQNSKIKRVVGGTVEVINGCQFTIKNMTLIPSSTDMYWYAIPLVKPPVEEPQTWRAVAPRLGNYNGNIITFTLDAEISWNDTAVMMIYSESDFRAVAAFGVRGKIKDYFNKDEEKAELKWDPTDPLANASKRILPQVFLLFFVSMMIYL